MAHPVHGVVTSHLRRSLAELAQLDGFSAALGGLVSNEGQSLVLSEMHALCSNYFRGALIRPGIGLGGKVLQLRRPVAVDNYVESDAITHQFDRGVLEDKLVGAVAIPIITGRQIRAVIYGASRAGSVIGERTVSTAVMLARKLSHDITVEEEIQRRLAAIKAEQAERERPSLSQRDMAEVNAELIAIASTITDPDARDRLFEVSDRLTGGTNGMAARAMVHLSRREADVLAQLAAGYTNAEIAERLAILPTTVKTHLKNTMRKLGARNRVETVTAARTAGLLP